MKTISSIVTIVKIGNVHFIKSLKDNKLYEVTPSHIFVPTDGDVQLVFKNGNEEIRLGVNEVECYTDRIAYETGSSPLPSCCITLDKISNRLSKYTSFLNEENRHVLKTIVMKDNVPTEVDAPIAGFVYTPDGYYDYVVWEDRVNEKELYRTEKDAIMFNPYKYTNNDGEEITREGTCSFALLTDKQKKAVDNLKKAFAELSKANVCASYDCETGMMYLFNAEKAYLEYEGASSDDAFLVTQVPEDQSFSWGINEFYEAPSVYQVKPKDDK